ncbi:MarR family transcriptional regulator [Micromonospora arborensis]|uniref:MarR family transcriptional regulator n=1 Tax=Micromonospora arborensis TaxID=2116518 RepID=A0A318NDB4_9ACTN|nr:MarR family transcriptional regulator [Micromonospora arborensis]PYC66179.1 MarR family transcriptional regulator [Micromonospora arborensis]
MSDVPPPRPPRPLGDRANFLLSQLGYYTAHRFARRLAPLGIQPNHFGLLMHLEQAEGRSQQQLADALGIHRKVMVGLLDDLESRGLAQRRRHPADRRAHAIHLTSQARDLLEQARAIADEEEEEVLTALDERERAVLVALLQRMASQTGNPPGVHPRLGATLA